jgi:hypothetical protein
MRSRCDDLDIMRCDSPGQRPDNARQHRGPASARGQYTLPWAAPRKSRIVANPAMARRAVIASHSLIVFDTLRIGKEVSTCRPAADVDGAKYHVGRILVPPHAATLRSGDHPPPAANCMADDSLSQATVAAKRDQGPRPPVVRSVRFRFGKRCGSHIDVTSWYMLLPVCRQETSESGINQSFQFSGLVLQP